MVETKMKALVILVGAGVIFGWLFLQYALERQTQMEPLLTADTALLLFLGFGLFAAFVYVIVRLTGRKY